MNFNLFQRISVLLCILASGCVGANVDDTGDDQSDLDSVRAASTNLFGAWVKIDSGTFQSVVFTRAAEGNRFIANVKPIVHRGAMPPSTDPTRIEGTFTAGANLLLRSTGTPAAGLASYYQNFVYQIAGTTLTLRQGGRVFATLQRVSSYCDDAHDCASQGLPDNAACPSSFVCEENSCVARCPPARGPICCCYTTVAPRRLGFAWKEATVCTEHPGDICVAPDRCGN